MIFGKFEFHDSLVQATSRDFEIDRRMLFSSLLTIHIWNLLINFRILWDRLSTRLESSREQELVVAID